MRVLAIVISATLFLPLLLKGGEQAKPSSIVHGAHGQIGMTLRYDPSYRALDYPNGDVPIELGVCADVVVRALRASRGIDLQKLVHEDMKQHFSRYPQKWGLRGPDKNIDHRRVPNLQTFFKRVGWELPVSKKPGDYQPGDIVTCIVPPHLPHIMIISDQTNMAQRPLIIHNIGRGAQEEDRLFESKLTGHYRVANIDPNAAPNAAPPHR
jgi:uncharacterized protein YijF (DUF1287 family)